MEKEGGEEIRQMLYESRNLASRLLSLKESTALCTAALIVALIFFATASLPMQQANAKQLSPASCLTPAVNLSNNSGQSTLPQEGSDPVVSKSNVYVAWTDTTPGHPQIFFRASHDKGTTFDSIINLSNDLGAATDPRLAVSGSSSDVYAVWQDTTQVPTSIFFRASHDDGTTFGPVIILSNNNGTSLTAQIAASGSSVYVAWEENNPTEQDIFFRASHDNGATFSPIINLSNNTALSREAAIAVYQNNVYVAWVDTSTGALQVFFRASRDGGVTFDPVINLSQSYSNSREPLFAVSGNNLYVVWPELDDAFFRASNDNGTTFAPPMDLSNNSGISREVWPSASGSNAYVIWRDNTPGNFDVLFSASHDNGATFSPVINLSGNSGISVLSGTTDRTQMAASGRNVYAVWDDNISGNYDVYFGASNDNGTTFGTIINLSNDSGTSNAQLVSASGNKAYVIWDDNTNTTNGNFDVFFSACTSQ